MANATVSHELRNPLNSMVAQNILKSKLYGELKLRLNNENQEIIRELEDGHEI